MESSKTTKNTVSGSEDASLFSQLKGLLFGTTEEKTVEGFKISDFDRVTEVMPVITYKAVIEYFATTRPPKLKKGAVLHWAKGEKYHNFVQFFLDEKNQPISRSDGKPFGRYFQAVNVDDELKLAFGKHDLLFVE